MGRRTEKNNNGGMTMFWNRKREKKIREYIEARQKIFQLKKELELAQGVERQLYDTVTCKGIGWNFKFLIGCCFRNTDGEYFRVLGVDGEALFSEVVYWQGFEPDATQRASISTQWEHTGNRMKPEVISIPSEEFDERKSLVLDYLKDTEHIPAVTEELMINGAMKL